jgi:hypothetical protein
MMACQVTVIPAEGVIFKRVLEATHPISPEGLSLQAYGKCDAAQMKRANCTSSSPKKVSPPRLLWRQRALLA